MRKLSNELPSGYTIRFAEKTDISAIMRFIEKHWKENHILAKDKDFFEYEFSIHTEKINFVLLLDAEGDIVGILGFIPYDETNRDMFTVMWKVLERDEIMFGGVLLLQYLKEHGECRHIYTSGINEGTRNIYRYLGLQTDNLRHYYRVNENMEQHLAVVCEREKIDESEIRDHCFKMTLVEDAEIFKMKYHPNPNPNQIAKSPEYIIHRYFEHPRYKYFVYEICEDDVPCNSYIIVRIQEHNGSKALRVIDYLGDTYLIEGLSCAIEQLLDELQCEYIDFYEYGIDDKILEHAGFRRNFLDSKNIIPNYFSPYICQNINIGIVFEKDTNPIIFKGDGDQDRPS